MPDIARSPVISTPPPTTFNLVDPPLVTVMFPLFATATFDVPFAIVVLSIAVVDVAVTIPFALTLIIGIAVLEPTVPALTPESANLLFAIAALAFISELVIERANLLIAIAALAFISAFKIAPSAIFALVTVLSAGVTSDALKTTETIKKLAPFDGAAAKIISLPFIAKPSDG